VPVPENNIPPVELVLGLHTRLRAISKCLHALSDKVARAGVSLSAGIVMRLSANVIRSVADKMLIAVVAAVVPSPHTSFFRKLNPSIELAVALPVTHFKKFKMLDVSLNSQLSIVRLLGVAVPVAV
jgi:hypothetical protein